MATIQHPSFESDTQVVDDPAPWIEQGWILLDEPGAVPPAVDVVEVPVEVTEVVPVDVVETVDPEVPVDVADVPVDVVEPVDVPETPADTAEPAAQAPKPGPRNKR